MNKLKVLDLFSGIGGFSLGLERTGGFETVAFCEIEEFPRRVLAKHWPDVPCYQDVRELTAERLAADGIAVDCITAGFPCQGISIAGKGLGLSDPRSGLWGDTARLIGASHERDRIWIVAYANSERRWQHYGTALAIPPLVARHSDHFGYQGWQTPWEQILEDVCRVDDGLRGRMDKLGFLHLGNAVVPQIPELIGNAILQAMAGRQTA